jgi:hypothetical protein
VEKCEALLRGIVRERNIPVVGNGDILTWHGGY